MRTISKIIVRLTSLFKNLFRFSKPVLLAFIVSNFFIYYFKINIEKIGDKDFLFSFFGIILGFAITIFTFIISLVEKIKEKAEKKYATEADKKTKFESKIKGLFSEIKDDITFTFISVVIIGLLYVVDVKIPKIYFYGNYFIDQKIGVESLKLALFFLNLYAIYDLIIVSFKMSDTTGILEIKEETKTGTVS